MTLVALLLFGIAAFNLLGVVSAIQRYTVLRQLPLSLPPAFLIFSSAVWAAVLALMALGLWRLKQWGRLGTLAALTLFLAQVWVERLVFGRSDYVQATWPYYLGLHGVGLALVWGLLLRRKVRRAFSA